MDSDIVDDRVKINIDANKCDILYMILYILNGVFRNVKYYYFPVYKTEFFPVYITLSPVSNNRPLVYSHPNIFEHLVVLQTTVIWNLSSNNTVPNDTNYNTANHTVLKLYEFLRFEQ